MRATCSHPWRQAFQLDSSGHKGSQQLGRTQEASGSDAVQQQVQSAELDAALIVCKACVAGTHMIEPSLLVIAGLCKGACTSELRRGPCKLALQLFARRWSVRLAGSVKDHLSACGSKLPSCQVVSASPVTTTQQTHVELL